LWSSTLLYQNRRGAEQDSQFRKGRRKYKGRAGSQEERKAGEEEKEERNPFAVYVSWRLLL
jgi:hypothetical protein